MSGSEGGGRGEKSVGTVLHHAERIRVRGDLDGSGNS